MLYISGNRQTGGFGGIGCLIVGGLLLIGMFYSLNWLYWKLWYAAPVFMVLALVINYKVVTASLTRYWEALVRNPISGLVSIAIAVALLPIITIGWFLGALTMNKFQKMQQEFGQQWGFGSFDPQKMAASSGTEFAEFEELETKKLKKEERED
jgi:hypothetical protein